jgi:retinol dehydrogenase 12
MTTQDLQGRTFLVTGANTGIGKVAAHDFAARGARVLLLCRSAEKTAPAVDEIRAATGNSAVEFVQVDLADLTSVRDCARGLLARDLPIHALINNAGLAGQRGLTAQGFEIAFGTNHLGHFLLTQLLLERIRASGPARIVNVSSKGHYRPSRLDFEALQQPTRTRVALHEYCISKLCNVLFTSELARRLDGTGVTTYSLHPGVVATDVWRRIPAPFRSVAKLFMRSSQDGARTTVYCATSPEVRGASGRYYDECREKQPSKLAQDPELAAELWRRSEAWVAPYAT